MRGTRVALIAVFAVVVLTVSFGAEAQQSGKVFRIGVLSNVPPSTPEGAHLWGAFFQGLRELGYVEGQNITIEHRSSEGKYERLPDLAAELVALKVDVIVAPATQGPLAVQKATRTIPIVMINSADAVTAGLVASLARPGGNVTGISGLSPEIAGKQLELLKQTVPKVRRVAILSNPAAPGVAPLVTKVKDAARSLGVQLQVLEARGPDDLKSAFTATTRERAGALLVFPDGVFLLHRTRIVDLTAKSRLPALYAGEGWADAGGLMSYAPNAPDLFRRAASYVDKVLKGAKPGDLPVEQPTTFELVINMKTAKTLALTIPPSVLLQADRVIE